MALSMQDLGKALQDRLSQSSGEKLTDLSSDVLLERHASLKTERLAMPDTSPAQDRAAVTNKVKRIEAVLRERGVEFEALPQANRPMALADMTDDELLAEFERIETEYDAATAGQKSSMTVRLKAMKDEVAKRLEGSDIEPAPQGEETTVTEAEEPTDEELAAVAASEGGVKTATPRRSRRRN